MRIYRLFLDMSIRTNRDAIRNVRDTEPGLYFALNGAFSAEDTNALVDYLIDRYGFEAVRVDSLN